MLTRVMSACIVMAGRVPAVLDVPTEPRQNVDGPVSR
jgi:hypothetical protein